MARFELSYEDAKKETADSLNDDVQECLDDARAALADFGAGKET